MMENVSIYLQMNWIQEMMLLILGTTYPLRIEIYQCSKYIKKYYCGFVQKNIYMLKLYVYIFFFSYSYLDLVLLCSWYSLATFLCVSLLPCLINYFYEHTIDKLENWNEQIECLLLLSPVLLMLLMLLLLLQHE